MVKRVGDFIDWDNMEKQVVPIAKEDAEIDDDTSQDEGNWSDWEKPSVEVAQRYQQLERFKEGKASIWKTDIIAISSMGPGLTLYFALLRWFGMIFALQTVIAAPSLYWYWSGDGINPEQADQFGLAYTTLGNLHQYDVQDILKDYQLTYESFDNASWALNQQSTALSFRESQMTKSYTVSALDVLNTFVFIAFIFWVQQAARTLVQQADERCVSPSDYAVLVEGLPFDSTEGQIREHFSNLYQLREPDWSWEGYFWKKRPRQPPQPVAGLGDQALLPEPVKEPLPGLSSDYIGSWVCEITLVRSSDGRVIQHCLDKRHIQEKLQRAKARLELAKKRATRKTIEKYRKRLTRYERRAERLRQSIKAFVTREGSKDYESKKQFSAFVVFNHAESQRRCLEDYSNSQSWIGGYPKPLRFRGEHMISVSKAPEPNDVKWENIGRSSIEILKNRLLVSMVTFLIILAGFSAAYWCESQFRKYRENLPDTRVCSLDLPAKHAGTYLLQGSEKYELKRMPSRDAECPFPGTIWLGYEEIEYGNVSQLDPCSSPCIPSSKAIQDSLSNEHMCYTLSVEQGCPSMKTPAQEANLNAECAQNFHVNGTLAYSARVSEEILQDPLGLEILMRAVDSVHCCDSYPLRTTSIACYCESQNLVSAFGNLSDVCGTYVETVALAQTMTMIPASIVVGINLAIRILAEKLSKFSLHSALTRQRLSIASKAFVAQFINTALMLLFLNGAVPSSYVESQGETNSSSTRLGSLLLQGELDDFNRNWYIIVGQAVIMSMVLNIIAHHVWPLFEAFVLLPLKQRYANRSAVTQFELNQAYAGVRFPATIRYVMLLNTVFVCLLYSAHMPILLPLGAMHFASTYWFDKYALLRFYRRPPVYNETFPELAIRLLPFALLGHVLFAFWAFGNADLMPSYSLDGAFSDYFDVSTNTSETESSSVMQNVYIRVATNLVERDRLGIFSHARQYASFPQFCLSLCGLAILVVWMMLSLFRIAPKMNLACGTGADVGKKLPGRLGKSKRKVHALRSVLKNPKQYSIKQKLSSVLSCPPYTDSFVHWTSQTRHDRRQSGWASETNKTNNVLVYKREGGRLLKTWEVIDKDYDYSYRLENRSGMYRDIIPLLQ